MTLLKPETFQKLKEVSLDLNNSTDSFNKSVAEIESFLQSLNLGIEAWVLMELNTEKPVPRKTYLGYAKASGKWGLHIKIEGLPESVWAFRGSPRQLRIQAVGFIPSLMVLLILNSQAFVTHMDEATGTLAEILTDIRR